MSTNNIKGIASCHTVAEEIASAYGLSEDKQTELCSRLLGAVATGKIQAREPDGTEREMVGNNWLATRPVHHPCVWVDDVNKWLAGRYPFVWVPAQTQGQPDNGRVLASTVQDNAILSMIRDKGYDPKKLPKNEPGKPGVKAEIKQALGTAGMWSGSKVFDKAWQRLRDAGEIANE